jgi:hypothetical protein
LLEIQRLSVDRFTVDPFAGIWKSRSALKKNQTRKYGLSRASRQNIKRMLNLRVYFA